MAKITETERERNKKLAEWRGFTNIEKIWEDEPNWGVYWGLEPSKEYKDGRIQLPDFLYSLDAIFKWLVPKAIDKLASTDLMGTEEATYKLFNLWLEEIARHPYMPNSEASDLCRAIEKLIDEWELIAIKEGG